MSWTDLIAVENILKLKKQFHINTAIATGTYRGFDTELYANYFEYVYSMDISQEYLDIAQERLKGYDNITLCQMSSWEFIKLFRQAYEIMHSNDTVFIYLDAHFYDPSFSPQDKWVAVKELQALKGFKNCVLCIHDFDCEDLGHLIYGGEHFGWNVIGKYITAVNPNFCYYINTREYTNICDRDSISQLPIQFDKYLEDSLNYVHSSDEKKYRGILYAVPQPLDLAKYRLKKYDQTRAY